MIPLVFFAQYGAVFALVMGSKLLRDDRWVLAMLNSILISLTQFTFVWIVAHSEQMYIVLFVSAVGGSLGCGTSHLFYTRWIMK